MTVDIMMTMLAAGLAGFLVASGLIHLRLKAPPRALMRTNVNGRSVPAVLGGPVSIAALAALAAVVLVGALGWEPARLEEVGAALALAFGAMAIAGSWDDRRGDERSRGFRGHLAELRRGRLSGGVVKILAGTIAGLGAGLLLWGDDLPRATATLLLVAGAANVVNLFDRAPGRAGKVVLVVALPIMALGHVAWGVGAAGALGALIASLPVDLAERAMLGDAGANPLGALVGLGLALSLQGWWLWAAVGVVLLLNAAAERWSFSRIIAATRLLDSFDRAGRK